MKSPNARILTLFVLLAIAWLLWSGIYKPLLLALGLLSCALTCYLSRRMGYFDKNFYMLHLSGQVFGYVIWLAKEVVRSSIEVSLVVLNPRLPVSPRIIEIDATELLSVGQAVLGNSITLTPGTLTLDVFEGKIKVHSLTRAGAEALVASEMDKRVAALHLS